MRRWGCSMRCRHSLTVFSLLIALLVDFFMLCDCLRNCSCEIDAHRLFNKLVHELPNIL